VRTRVALAAGAGDEAALVTAMARRLIAVFVLLGVLTTFGRKTAAALVLLGSERFEHYDLLLRKRSYATCRCCMNLPLQVRAL
jgi:hypothetical protein